MTRLKAIKVIINQQTASFRKPTSRTIQESYPLPPYSTILGFIHTMCGYDTYHDMQLSIQGSFKSKTMDFAQQVYTATSYNPSRHLHNAGGIGVGRGIASIEMLIDMTSVIHIVPNDNDFDYVYQSLLNPAKYPALGRHEDIATIVSVDIVELEWNEFDEDISNKHAAYIPINLIDDVIDTATQAVAYGGSYFTLGKQYTIDEKTNRRVFNDPVDVLYTSNYHIFADEQVLCDDTMPVFLV